MDVRNLGILTNEPTETWNLEWGSNWWTCLTVVGINSSGVPFWSIWAEKIEISWTRPVYNMCHFASELRNRNLRQGTSNPQKWPPKNQAIQVETLRFRSFRDWGTICFWGENTDIFESKGHWPGLKMWGLRSPYKKKWFIWFIVHPPQDPETYFNPKQSPGTGRNIVFLTFFNLREKGGEKIHHFLQLQVAHLWSKDWGENGMSTWLAKAKRLVGCVFCCAKTLGEDRRVEWVCLFFLFCFYIYMIVFKYHVWSMKQHANMTLIIITISIISIIAIVIITVIPTTNVTRVTRETKIKYDSCSWSYGWWKKSCTTWDV